MANRELMLNIITSYPHQGKLLCQLSSLTSPTCHSIPLPQITLLSLLLRLFLKPQKFLQHYKAEQVIAVLEPI